MAEATAPALQAAGPGPGDRRRPTQLGADGPGGRPVDRPRFDRMVCLDVARSSEHERCKDIVDRQGTPPGAGIFGIILPRVEMWRQTHLSRRERDRRGQFRIIVARRFGTSSHAAGPRRGEGRGAVLPRSTRRLIHYVANGRHRRRAARGPRLAVGPDDHIYVGGDRIGSSFLARRKTAGRRDRPWAASRNAWRSAGVATPTPAASTSAWKITSKCSTPGGTAGFATVLAKTAWPPVAAVASTCARPWPSEDSLRRRRRQSHRVALRSSGELKGRIGRGRHGPHGISRLPHHQPLLRPGLGARRLLYVVNPRALRRGRPIPSTATWNFSWGNGIAGGRRFLRLLQPGAFGRAAGRAAS